MNRLRFSRGYIRATACICVAAVACGTTAVAAQEITPDQVQWYRSDAEMIRRDPIAAERAPAVGESPPTEVKWALAVHREEAPRDRYVEVARLYRNGTYHGYERTELSDRGSLLLQRERFNHDEELVYRELFRYRQDGTLRETLRVDDAGDAVVILYGMPENSWDEYVQAPDYSITHRFDDQGRPAYTRREERRVSAKSDTIDRGAPVERPQSPGDTDAPVERPDSPNRTDVPAAEPDATDTVREEWFFYRDERLAERRVAEGERRELYRYRDGRIVHEEIQVDGRIVRTVERSFDDEDRVTEVIVREAGTVQREIWRRNADGTSEMERIEDGVRVLLDRTTADGDRTVTRYRHGEPVVREFYADDSVYQRQIFADGEIVRVEER